MLEPSARAGGYRDGRPVVFLAEYPCPGGVCVVGAWPR